MSIMRESKERKIERKVTTMNNNNNLAKQRKNIDAIYVAIDRTQLVIAHKQENREVNGP